MCPPAPVAVNPRPQCLVAGSIAVVACVGAWLLAHPAQSLVATLASPTPAPTALPTEPVAEASSNPIPAPSVAEEANTVADADTGDDSQDEPEADTRSPPTPPAKDEGTFPGEHFPQTRTAVLTDTDIATWKYAGVRYAVNEIYARHGFAFKKKPIASEFGKKSWYRPDPRKSQPEVERGLSDIERSNLRLPSQRRDRLKAQGLAE